MIYHINLILASWWDREGLKPWLKARPLQAVLWKPPGPGQPQPRPAAHHHQPHHAALSQRGRDDLIEQPWDLLGWRDLGKISEDFRGESWRNFGGTREPSFLESKPCFCGTFPFRIFGGAGGERSNGNDTPMMGCLSLELTLSCSQNMYRSACSVLEYWLSHIPRSTSCQNRCRMYCGLSIHRFAQWLVDQWTEFCRKEGAELEIKIALELIRFGVEPEVQDGECTEQEQTTWPFLQQCAPGWVKNARFSQTEQ